MTFSILDTEDLTLEDLCEQACEEADIGPASIILTPICSAEVDPYRIDCDSQLAGTQLTLTQNYSERKTQCSTSAASYIPSGKMGMFVVSLAEGGVDSRLLEIITQSRWLKESPYEGDEGPILAALNEPGRCPIKFKAEICPSGGARDLVFPCAQLYTENIELGYDNTTQREMKVALYAQRDKRTEIVYYWRSRENEVIDFENSPFIIE